MMLKRSFIQVQMVTLGETINSLWNKSHPWSRFSRLLIQTAKLCLFLISHPLMHLYLTMLSKHLKWINPTVGCSIGNVTPLFLIQTQIPNSDLNHRWAKRFAGSSWGMQLWCFKAQSQMQTSLHVWKQKLLHGQCDSELGSYPGQGRQVSGVLAAA